MGSNSDSHSTSHANAVVSHAACGDGWGRDPRPVAPKVRRADLRADFRLVAYPRKPWLGDGCLPIKSYLLSFSSVSSTRRTAACTGRAQH